MGVVCLMSRLTSQYVRRQWNQSISSISVRAHPQQWVLSIFLPHPQQNELWVLGPEGVEVLVPESEKVLPECPGR